MVAYGRCIRADFTGVTITFGVMKMVNFAMGDIITVGMYWLGAAT